MILNKDYSSCKGTVSKHVNKAVGALRAESGAQSARLGKKIAITRTLLWVATILIIIILAFSFILLNNLILRPLYKFVTLINSDYELDDQTGAYEVRMLASAYNDLKWRRDALDELLRAAAETDTLTNLPNRYKYEQLLMEFGKSGYSLAVFLFDINFLKVTNDQYGHAAGDALIKTAAECISSSFDLSQTNIQGESYCFRFGGDEFAALVKDCSEEDARKLADRFESRQKLANISISVGYAYTPDIASTSFKKLMDEADMRMYEQKEAKHRQDFDYSKLTGATV